MEVYLPRKSLSLKHNNENIEKLACDKTIVDGSLSFEDCIFEHIDLNNLKVKNGSLTFKRCRFNSQVFLKNMNVDADINFIECESVALIKFFNISANGQVFLEYLKSDKKIEFVDVSFTSVKLSSVNIDFISFNSHTSNKIQSIEFSDCVISNTLSCTKIEGCNFILIRGGKINELRLNSLVVTDAGVLEIKECTMDISIIDRLIFSSNTNILLDDNLIDLLKVDDFTLENGLLSISKGFYKNIVIGSKIPENLRVDFSSTSYDFIEIDHKFYEFLRKDAAISNLLLEGDYEQNSKVMQLLSKMFADNYQYSLQDLCFYHYNNFVMKSQILQSNSSVNKSILRMKYFFGRFLFGWGVKLRNIVNSFFYVAILYSIIYSSYFNFKPTSYTFKNFSLNGDILNSFYMSAYLTFGSYSDFKVADKFLDFLMYSQHLIGILFLAILTGTIIRKLVR